MASDYAFFNRWRGHVPRLMGAGSSYAVLVPLVWEPGQAEPSLLFEVRAASLRRQPGEVCFPGGRMEPGETPEQCALREAWEELGIPAAAVEVIGPMELLCHQSGFLVHPILAWVCGQGGRAERLNAAEVAETFLVPVSRFFQPPQVYTYPLQPVVGDDFPYDLIGFPQGYAWRGGQVEVPIYPCGAHTVWGLTGRIVRELFREQAEPSRP